MKKSQRKPVRESDRQIDTVAKALQILDCFTAEAPELSLKQLSEKTGLYKSRIIRLCGTLIAHGFLIRTEALYKLGPKLLILGKVYERTSPLTALARPVMKRLSALTGETTKIFVIDDHQRLCLVRELGPFPLRYAINEGDKQALYAGAGGKVLLAFAPEAFRGEIINNSLKKITPATIIDPDLLEKDLEGIRQQGYAFTKAELVPEVAGLAAPVYNHENIVCAAFTITGPIQRFTQERVDIMLKQLFEATHELSFLLGKNESGR